MSTVAVVIASIPPRKQQLAEALASVAGQTRTPDAIHVAIDTEGLGEAPTRNRALYAATTDYVAIMDDDDLMGSRHIELLMDEAERTGADLVYPWFTMQGCPDPLDRFGEPFDAEELKQRNYIPVTVLARTEAIQENGFPLPGSEDWPHATCVDWGCWLKMVENGAKIVHLPARTWIWRLHWGEDGKQTNTSGRSWKEIYKGSLTQG